MQVVDVFKLLNANTDGDFLNVAAFNGHTIDTSRTSGRSVYLGRRPAADELYALEGALELDMLPDPGTRRVEIPTDSVGVVPNAIRHRPGSANGTAFFNLTPGDTLHSDKADPREKFTDA